MANGHSFHTKLLLYCLKQCVLTTHFAYSAAALVQIVSFVPAASSPRSGHTPAVAGGWVDRRIWCYPPSFGQ